MNQEINFLPERYRKAQDTQRRKLREVGLCALVLAAIAGWAFSSQDQLRELRQYAHDVELEARVTRQKVSEVAKQRALRSQLRRQVGLQRKLIKTIGTTEVLATLASLAPSEIALTELAMTSPRPDPAKIGAAIKPRGASQTHASEEAFRVDVMGVAPDDQHIALLVERLTKHPLFEDVKLSFSRAAERDNLHVRKFHIELTVPLDRDYAELPSAAAPNLREAQQARDEHDAAMGEGVADAS